jgi:hypothetical protein
MALPEVWRFTGGYRRSTRPLLPWSLVDYARALLENKGEWDRTLDTEATRMLEEGWMAPDPVLTPKAEKELEEMPRLVRRKRGN